MEARSAWTFLDRALALALVDLEVAVAPVVAHQPVAAVKRSLAIGKRLNAC